MIDLKSGQLTDILPASIKRDVEVQCISYALHCQIEKMAKLADRTRTTAMIDDLPERILDVLATELRTPYYTESMNLQTKRDIIKNTIMWHAKAGTPSAVAELIAVIFGTGEVVEWFDFEEPPYTPGTFDIVTSARMTEEMTNDFLQIVRRVKNTRSHIRRILVLRGMEMRERSASATVAEPRRIALNHFEKENGIAMRARQATGATLESSEVVTNAPKRNVVTSHNIRAYAGLTGHPDATIVSYAVQRKRAGLGYMRMATAATARTHITIFNTIFQKAEFSQSTHNATTDLSHSSVTI